MNFTSPCFGSFGQSKNIQYCAPLQQLFDEHPSLLAKMADFYQLTKEYETNDTIEDWNEVINHLHQKINVFVAELEPHSDREEDILFEMMVTYIGRENGPIAVMEYEHNTAKQNLKAFMDKVAVIHAEHKTITQEEALQIMKHLKIVYMTLTDHFMKEEQILFPMAEQMLTAQEKQLLAEKFAETV